MESDSNSERKASELASLGGDLEQGGGAVAAGGGLGCGDAVAAPFETLLRQRGKRDRVGWVEGWVGVRRGVHLSAASSPVGWRGPHPAGPTPAAPESPQVTAPEFLPASVPKSTSFKASKSPPTSAPESSPARAF